MTASVRWSGAHRTDAGPSWTLRKTVRAALEQVVHRYLEWGDEVVEGGVREAFSKVDDA